MVAHACLTGPDLPEDTLTSDSFVISIDGMAGIRATDTRVVSHTVGLGFVILTRTIITITHARLLLRSGYTGRESGRIPVNMTAIVITIIPIYTLDTLSTTGMMDTLIPCKAITTATRSTAGCTSTIVAVSPIQPARLRLAQLVHPHLVRVVLPQRYSAHRFIAISISVDIRSRTSLSRTYINTISSLVAAPSPCVTRWVRPWSF